MGTPYQSDDAAAGIHATRELTHRQVMLANEKSLPGLFILAGEDARDPLNSVDVRELRAGLLVGRNTTTKKFGCSIIGVTGEAVDGAETEIDVAAAVATELIRRQGASGTFKLTGPPTAGGTVRTLTATYSAVAATAITITALGAAAVWTLTPVDGTDGGTFKLRVTLEDGTFEDTADITFNATGATFQAAIDAAIEALTILPDDAVTVASTDTTGVSVMTFISSLGAVKVQVIESLLTDGGVFEGQPELVETTTGVNGEFVAGSFIQPTDGTETPVTIFLGRQGYPVKAVDVNDNDRDLELGTHLIGGLVDSSQIINWPSDTALQAWLVNQLNATGQANFTFDHLHGQ